MDGSFFLSTKTLVWSIKNWIRDPTSKGFFCHSCSVGQMISLSYVTFPASVQTLLLCVRNNVEAAVFDLSIFIIYRNCIVILANENTKNWKRLAHLVKIANMRGECWKLKEKFLEKGQIYRRLYGWLARLPPSHTNVCKRCKFWRHILKPVSILFLSNFAC